MIAYNLVKKTKDENIVGTSKVLVQSKIRPQIMKL